MPLLWGKLSLQVVDQAPHGNAHCNSSIPVSPMLQKVPVLVQLKGARENECRRCHKVFGRGYTLKYHMKTVHTVTAKFKCRLCALVMKNKHDLVYHNNKIHTGAKPYKCETCHVAFHSPTTKWKHKKSCN